MKILHSNTKVILLRHPTLVSIMVLSILIAIASTTSTSAIAQLCTDSLRDAPLGYDITSLDVGKTDTTLDFTISVFGSSSDSIVFTQYFRIDLADNGAEWYYVAVDVNEATGSAIVVDHNITSCAISDISASYSQSSGQITISVPLECLPSGDLTRIYAKNTQDVAPDGADQDPDNNSCQVSPPIPVPEPFYAAIATLAIVATVLYTRRHSL